MLKIVTLWHKSFTVWRRGKNVIFSSLLFSSLAFLPARSYQRSSPSRKRVKKNWNLCFCILIRTETLFAYFSSTFILFMRNFHLCFDWNAFSQNNVEDGIKTLILKCTLNNQVQYCKKNETSSNEKFNNFTPKATLIFTNPIATSCYCW